MNNPAGRGFSSKIHTKKNCTQLSIARGKGVGELIGKVTLGCFPCFPKPTRRVHSKDPFGCLAVLALACKLVWTPNFGAHIVEPNALESTTTQVLKVIKAVGVS